MQKPENYPDFSLTPQEARKRFLKLLGPLFPPPTPLNLRFEGQAYDLGNGLRRQRVLYDVEPGEAVPAYLFLHEEDKPRPAIVTMHGYGSHFPVGKDGVSMPNLSNLSAYAYRAAREGFVVLAPDAICFGERRTHCGYSQDFWYELIIAMESSL